MNLKKVYYIKQEIKSIRAEIENINDIEINNKQDLIDRLNNMLGKYCDELIKINDYIDRIKNDEIRLIARYRYIDNLTWEEIGERMHLDRTACYRKMKKYLNEHKKHN